MHALVAEIASSRFALLAMTRVVNQPASTGGSASAASTIAVARL
jgi:hypothetical protein